MPINSQHKEYTNFVGRWEKCRDAYAGEEAIKGKNDTYLPLLSSMDSVQDTKYIAYKNRAMFYAATARTVEGLVGMALRKPVSIELPTKYEEFKEDITNTGTKAENFIKDLLSEVTLTARSGVLVDKGTDSSSRPYAIAYAPENIVNWRLDDEGKLILLVLREYEEVVDAQDKYSTKIQEMYRELYIDEETGKYTVRLWKEDGSKKGEYVAGDPTMPVVRGAGMEDIPFVFITPKGTNSIIEKPPLLDMINVNLSHYRTSADLEHGRHFTALPTPYIFGVDEIQDENGNPKPVVIGSETAIVSSSPQGSAGYMEFTGQGLSALERAMEEKSEYMVVLGATILQNQKKAAEAAETARINKSGDSSTMVSIVLTVEDAMQQIFDLMIAWESGTEKSSVEINKDLLDSVIDPQLITALVSSWQSGAISHETLLHNLKKGEILADDVSIEDELSKIDDEGPEDTDETLDLTPEERRRNLKVVKNEEDGSFSVSEEEAV